MSSKPTTHIDGDASVGRNVTIGGSATIRGNATVDHNLKVRGWLDAPNIKGANKGYFSEKAELENAYPSPKPGWWAVVTEQNTIYIVQDGHWIDSGKEAPDIKIDCEQYEQEVADMQLRLDDVKLDIQEQSETLKNHDGRIESLNRRYDDLDLHLQNELEPRLDGFDTEIGRLKEEDNALKTRTTQLETQVETLLDKTTDTSEELGLTNGRVVELQRQLTSTNETLEKACNDIETNGGRLDEQKARLDEQKARLDEHKGRLDSAESAISDLRRRSDDTLQLAQANEADTVQLRSELEDTKSRIGSLESRHQSLVDKVYDEVVENIADFSAELQTQDERISGVESGLAETSERAQVATIAPGWVNLNSLLGTMDAFSSLSAARAVVPEKMRRPGVRLTYLQQTTEEDTKEWVSYQYVDSGLRDSGQWDDDQYWCSVEETAAKTKSEFERVIDTGTVVTFIMDDGEEYSVQGSKLIKNDGAAFEAAFDGQIRFEYYCPAQIMTAYTTLKDFLPYFKVSNGGLVVKPTCFEVEPKAASACRMDFGMFTCPNGYAAVVDEIELRTYYEPTDAAPAHPRLRALYQGEEQCSITLERAPQGIARLRLDKNKVELNGGFSLEISPNTKVSFMHFLIKGHLEKIQAGYESGLSMIGEWDDPATINEENNEADTLTEHEALGA